MNNSYTSEESIINRVANSGLVTIDLEQYYHPGERVIYDLKDHLFQGLILREKEFRQSLKETDWTFFKDKNVAIICSADAIVPLWAYMLVAIHLDSYANMVVLGNLDELENRLFQECLAKIRAEEYKDAKVVIKGCSRFSVPGYAYVEITRLLIPYVQSLMFGEPCSTVPLFKRKKDGVEK